MRITNKTNTERDLIIRNFIVYFLNNERKYASLLGKKLNETLIPLDYILNTLEKNKIFMIDKTNLIQNAYGKVSYLFKMIENYYSIDTHDSDNTTI